MRPVSGFDALLAYFLDRLVPVCTQLLEAAAVAGEIRSDMDAYELMRGVVKPGTGADSDPHYDARRPVEPLVAGLRRPHQLSAGQLMQTGHPGRDQREARTLGSPAQEGGHAADVDL